MGWRSTGGSSMVLMSRMPLMAIFRVRGIGVAERVSMSTPMNAPLSFSLVLDPKALFFVNNYQPKIVEFYVVG